MTEQQPTAMTSSEAATFARFIATGGIAAVVNFGSRFAFDVFVSYSVAIVLAYLCGMVTAFVLAKAFVFTSSTRTTTHSAIWFTVINVIAVAQTWLVSMGLARIVFPGMGFEFHPEAVAHAIGIMVPVFTSFLGHKHLSFRAGP